ncbi:hypothetical protein HYC85_003387 [Camellia sinensis]|uniref:Protein kinase domain-containing protein n=1 Tax=Camellia sinensis TaxID=4442 RepID=A0A7J7IDC3_CAMSI|nr:hypothetical protein HYC85_003387 [Camellia sinensis]
MTQQQSSRSGSNNTTYDQYTFNNYYQEYQYGEIGQPIHSDDQSDVRYGDSSVPPHPYNYLGTLWNFHNESEGFICNFTRIECWRNEENRVLNFRLLGMGLKVKFPRGIVNCSSLTGSDLSNNNLFGTIPSNISSLIPFVTSLDLLGNSFSGEIPKDIANSSYLLLLKLDNNLLIGKIPPELGLLECIKSFISCRGQCLFFSYVIAESYTNNKGLCGGPLKCYKALDAYYHAFYLNGFVVGCLVSTVVAFALNMFYLPIDPLLKKIVSNKKKKRNQKVVQRRQWRPTAMNRVKDAKVVLSSPIWIEIISKLEKLVTRISFTKLVNATDNFREDNMIGLGKMGIMYKVVFPNGSFLAIKRFFESQFSEGHFMSEVMTLGRLRHNNLVPLFVFCYEGKEKLLVYKYIPNGNLYDWLHPPKCEFKTMKWPMRLHHHNKKFWVFNKNISSKCVLLDKNFEPKIFNFARAKFMNSNDAALGGSPITNEELLELGFDKKDVYSFGIVLLELLTRKEHPLLKLLQILTAIWLNGSSIFLQDVVDDPLIGLGFDGEIFEFINIACKCIQSVPEQRPTMLQVYQTMRATGKKHGIVDDY